MIELARRVALAAGVAWGVWLFGWSPVALFRVETVDFSEEYQKAYGARKGPVFPDAISVAKEYLRRNTNPGSVEAYRKRELENKLLKPAADVTGFFQEVARAESLWLPAEHPMIAAHMDQIRKIREVWLVSYLPSGISPNHYIQIRWETTPKKSEAPAELVHPYRKQGLAWMAAALLAYLLLPARRPEPQEAHQDGVMLAALDGVSIVFFALILYFPFHLADSGQEVMDSLVGGTGFFWVLASPFFIRLLLNAVAASERVTAGPEGLRIQSLFGCRTVAFHQIRRVLPLANRGRRYGWRIDVAENQSVDLHWSRLLNLDEVSRILLGFQAQGRVPSPPG